MELLKFFELIVITKKKFIKIQDKEIKKNEIK